MKNSFRYIPEWEIDGPVLMAFPHPGSDWNYIIDEARDQFLRLLQAFLNNGESVILLLHPDDREGAQILESYQHPALRIVRIPFNDTWTRDYGPVTIFFYKEFLYLDFGFNGWGLKFPADKDNLVNVELKRISLLPGNQYSSHRGFILEGGALETDGEGTLLTTSHCLLSPNRNPEFSKDDIEEYLKEVLALERVLWLNHGDLAGDDTDSHIDTLCRFAPGNVILFTGAEETDSHYKELALMRKELEAFSTPNGGKYTLLELPLPDPIIDEDEGIRLPATYANYLVTPRNIFLPVYNQPQKDRAAIEIVGKAFPGKPIITVDCRTLIRQHGSLHCSTMTLPLPPAAK